MSALLFACFLAYFAFWWLVTLTILLWEKP